MSKPVTHFAGRATPSDIRAYKAEIAATTVRRPEKAKRPNNERHPAWKTARHVAARS